MPRRDKNNQRTPGRENSNQSNQIDKHSRSSHNRNRTGTTPSEPGDTTAAADSDRNRDDAPQKMKPFSAEEKRFNLVVDNVPYMVRAVPFTFNDEVRYQVSFNGSADHVFTWDSSLSQLRAIDDESSTMPDNLELAISEKLQSKA